MRTVITIVKYLLFCAYRVALNNTSLLELPAVILQRIASHNALWRLIRIILSDCSRGWQYYVYIVGFPFLGVVVFVTSISKLNVENKYKVSSYKFVERICESM